MAEAVRFQSSISVVLPALDEEDNIEKAARDAAEYLRGDFAAFEVIVVDDGSTDRTATVVRELSAEIPEVRLVSHPKNLGYGRALASGFAAARHDLVAYTDADNQFDIRELRDTVPLLHDADAVFGFRVYRYDSVTRCLLSWVYNRLVRVLFRVRVRDVDCAFKVFKAEVLRDITIESNDFFVDTELVARTAKQGYHSAEKGVRHYPRTAGRTTVRPSHIPRTLWTVARMWFRIHFPGKSKASTAEAATTDAR